MKLYLSCSFLDYDVRDKTVFLIYALDDSHYRQPVITTNGEITRYYYKENTYKSVEL